MVAANGSGLAMAVGFTSPAFGGFKALDVLDVSDPANTANFLARFNLPADPYSVAIASGIAFVADGVAGLQVVSYVPLTTKESRRSFPPVPRRPMPLKAASCPSTCKSPMTSKCATLNCL